jgi:hypothetical protein
MTGNEIAVSALARQLITMQEFPHFMAVADMVVALMPQEPFEDNRERVVITYRSCKGLHEPLQINRLTAISDGYVGLQTPFVKSIFSPHGEINEIKTIPYFIYSDHGEAVGELKRYEKMELIIPSLKVLHSRGYQFTHCSLFDSAASSVSGIASHRLNLPNVFRKDTLPSGKTMTSGMLISGVTMKVKKQLY